MTSVLKVDNIQNSSGTQSMNIHSSGFVIPPAGGLIQMQYDQYTGADTQSLSLRTPTAVDNLSVNITPTSANSIIKVEGHLFFELSHSESEYNHMLFFYRDTTSLIPPNAGARTAGITQSTAAFYSNDASTTPQAAYFSYFDAPSSTSQITYKMGITVGQACTLYMNRTANDGNDYSKERGISFISVTEIAG